MKNSLIQFLYSLKNAAAVQKITVNCKYTNLNLACARILYQNGYILSFKVSKSSCSITVYLNLYGGKNHFHHLRILSKGSFNSYVTLKDLQKVFIKQTLLVFLTPKGLMSSDQLKKHGTGGIALFIIKC
jgi:ribosomal protein S8